VARGEARVNLAGEAVGEVSEDQKAHAEAKLAELAPKLPKRPERPARKGAEAEDAGGEAQAERPRRARAPSAHGRRPSSSPAVPRGEGRAGGKGEGRKPRREAGAPRPPRADRPARTEEPATPVLSTEEKLSLLLEKFGGK
jgi:sRNA-binding protein